MEEGAPKGCWSSGHSPFLSFNQGLSSRMTEVLSIQTQTDQSSHFGTPLHRSPSHTSFLLPNPTSYSQPPSPTLKSKYASVGYDNRPSSSLPSSAPSSPRLSHPEFSNQPSYTSTPSSSLSLDEQCDQQDEGIIFPSYGDGGYCEDYNELENPSSLEPQSPNTVPRSASDSSIHSPSKSVIPEALPTAGDDLSMKREPTRHVDYLSHSWKEEDIWASWRHIVAKRNVYSNSQRLENASWRTWTKSKYQLKTVSPETLNWYALFASRRLVNLMVHFLIPNRLKDHDVTWLYGPLQTNTVKPLDFDSAPPASQLSRSNSFGSKKPILKRRSLSEIMLQRSLSSSTLMKQATDSLRAQQPGKRLRNRPTLGDRVLPGSISSSNPGSPDGTPFPPTALSSASTSGKQTPRTKRHIHFNNKVEQCIAINKGGDDHGDYFNAIHDDSDDDMLTMKPVRSNGAKISTHSIPRNSFSGESKTIAMLPSTTLNCRGDTPEPAKQKSKQQGGFWSLGSKLNPSPSQETLRPSAPSSNFLLADEDEDADLNWQPSACGGRRDSIFPMRRSRDEENDDEGTMRAGLRRTPSGMFMPYEEDENDFHPSGVFGKVVDTVNTAKDIAHVI